ncbi:MAG: hypothetical protein U0414_36770 [Polyangiaceae bacterium]
MSEGAAPPGRAWFTRIDEALAAHRALASALVFLVALAPRIGVALGCAHEPVWDGQYYHYGAQRIAAGLGYGDPSGPWSHYPVGYSGFLALFYGIAGPNPIVGAVAGALVGALTAVAIVALGRAAFGGTPGCEARAVGAGVLVALHPGLVLQAALLMSEPLMGLGLVLAPLAMLAFGARRGCGAGVAGAIVGLTAWVRPEALLGVFGLAIPSRLLGRWGGKTAGRACDRVGGRAARGGAVVGAQLCRDGWMRARVDERGMEPRDRRVAARDGPVRGARGRGRVR